MMAGATIGDRRRQIKEGCFSPALDVSRPRDDGCRREEKLRRPPMPCVLVFLMLKRKIELMS
jgi:hypothetical protein